MPRVDPHDIEQLFKLLYEPLCRYAFTILKNMADAEDVVQNVFLQFIEKQKSIDIQVSARSYLYKMVHHACLNFLRNSEIQTRHLMKLGNPDENITTEVFKEETQREIRQRIDSVLDQLSPQCRAVFLKSRAESMKYSEIAAALGISVKTVEAHMSKALKIISGTLRVFLLFVYLTSVCSSLNYAGRGI